MSVGSRKNKNDLLIDKEKSVDKSVSDAINEAFDNVELSTVGKLCLDARLNKGQLNVINFDNHARRSLIFSN